MFHLCLLSANLSLSFSPSHQVTLVSGVWQPRCRCSPVRNRASKPTVKNLNYNLWNVTALRGLHIPHLSPEVLISQIFSKGQGRDRFCKMQMKYATSDIFIHSSNKYVFKGGENGLLMMPKATRPIKLTLKMYVTVGAKLLKIWSFQQGRTYSSKAWTKLGNNWNMMQITWICGTWFLTTAMSFVQWIIGCRKHESIEI